MSFFIQAIDPDADLVRQRKMLQAIVRIEQPGGRAHGWWVGTMFVLLLAAHYRLARVVLRELLPPLTAASNAIRVDGLTAFLGDPSIRRESKASLQVVNGGLSFLAKEFAHQSARSVWLTLLNAADEGGVTPLLVCVQQRQHQHCRCGIGIRKLHSHCVRACACAILPVLRVCVWASAWGLCNPASQLRQACLQECQEVVCMHAHMSSNKLISEDWKVLRCCAHKTGRLAAHVP